MKTKLFIYAALMLALGLFSSCDNKPNQVGLDEMEVVATATTIGNSKLISCDLTKLKDTLDLPLSYLVESLEIVKLDNRDEALVGNSLATVTESYILVKNNKHNPYKLFDKSGKFLTTIGSYGQGPNEYLNVYDDYMDEENNRIYILPWQTDKLLVYDLEGNAHQPIPLIHRVPKGRFYIDTQNKTVSVFLLPFSNIPVVAWTQDFEGNEIGSIPAGHLSVQPDYSNEVNSNKNSDAFDCSLFTFFELRPDSIYHYNTKDNILEPVFTLDFKNLTRKIHWYYELPNHFIGNVTIEKKLSDYTSTTEVPAKFIVDKKTLKGAFYKLHNDFLGNIFPDWATFYNGYYTWNVEPAVFVEQLSNALKENSDIDEKERKRLTELIDACNENDNNYLVYGKLKR